MFGFEVSTVARDIFLFTTNIYSCTQVGILIAKFLTLFSRTAGTFLAGDFFVRFTNLELLKQFTKPNIFRLNVISYRVIVCILCSVRNIAPLFTFTPLTIFTTEQRVFERKSFDADVGTDKVFFFFTLRSSATYAVGEITTNNVHIA